jgi:hypothetical protein
MKEITKLKRENNNFKKALLLAAKFLEEGGCINTLNDIANFYKRGCHDLHSVFCSCDRCDEHNDYFEARAEFCRQCIYEGLLSGAKKR